VNYPFKGVALQWKHVTCYERVFTFWYIIQSLKKDVCLLVVVAFMRVFIITEASEMFCILEEIISHRRHELKRTTRCRITRNTVSEASKGKRNPNRSFSCYSKWSNCHLSAKSWEITDSTEIKQSIAAEYQVGRLFNEINSGYIWKNVSYAHRMHQKIKAVILWLFFLGFFDELNIQKNSIYLRKWNWIKIQ